jgi:hypothetical protein
LARGQIPTARPSAESLRNAVLFGNSGLMKVIDDSVPAVIAPEQLLPWLFHNFDRGYTLVSKIPEAMLQAIPDGVVVAQGLPLASTDFSTLLLGLIE